MLLPVMSFFSSRSVSIFFRFTASTGDSQPSRSSEERLPKYSQRFLYFNKNAFGMILIYQGLIMMEFICCFVQRYLFGYFFELIVEIQYLVLLKGINKCFVIFNRQEIENNYNGKIKRENENKENIIK